MFYTKVYKDSDNWYVAESDEGEILEESNTEPETVIQAALDRKADVKICGPADYNLSATFDGLYFKSHTVLYSDYGATLSVPDGYSGGVLIADPTVNGDTLKNVNMTGGLTIKEQGGSPDGLWTGILVNLEHATYGVAYCDFGNCFIRNSTNAVALDLKHNTGWITTCNFSKITVYYTVNGINFINTIASSAPGFSTLNFENFWFQSAPQSAYGVKNSMGNNIWYKNCAIWDVHLSSVPGGMHSSQFSTLATNHFVLGGIMMHYQVDDQAAKGQVRFIDAHGPVPQWEFYKFTYETNGSATGSKTYTIPHNMGLSPDFVFVKQASSDALSSPIRWTHDTTNVVVTYQGTPPPPSTAGNTNNVKFELWCSVR